MSDATVPPLLCSMVFRSNWPCNFPSISNSGLGTALRNGPNEDEHRNAPQSNGGRCRRVPPPACLPSDRVRARATAVRLLATLPLRRRRRLGRRRRRQRSRRWKFQRNFRQQLKELERRGREEQERRLECMLYSITDGTSTSNYQDTGELEKACRR